MSIAATFGHALSGSPGASEHSDNKRWAVSFALVLALHAVAAVLVLRWYQNLPAPPAAPPSMTMIELAPLPPPPAPPVAVPTPPAPQVQRQEEPVPVAKPLLPAKPKVVKHVEPQHVQQQTTETVTPNAAPVTAPAAPAAPAQPTVNPSMPRFTDLIAAQLERYKRYPALAQHRGEQGVAMLRFTLGRAGDVSNARIEHGSGYADLDAEVLALVQRAQPLPPIPADIAANTLDIQVPVKFALH